MEQFRRRAEDQGQESSRDMLIEVRADLKNLIKTYDAHEIKEDARFEKFGTRIGSLETDRTKVWTIASVLGVLGGLITKLFIK